MNLFELKKLGYKFEITCSGWKVYHYVVARNIRTKPPAILGASHVLVGEGSSGFLSGDIRVRNKTRARHNRKAAREFAHAHFVKIRVS